MAESQAEERTEADKKVAENLSTRNRELIRVTILLQSAWVLTYGLMTRLQTRATSYFLQTFIFRRKSTQRRTHSRKTLFKGYLLPLNLTLKESRARKCIVGQVGDLRLLPPKLRPHRNVVVRMQASGVEISILSQQRPK